MLVILVAKKLDPAEAIVPTDMDLRWPVQVNCLKGQAARTFQSWLFWKKELDSNWLQKMSF